MTVTTTPSFNRTCKKCGSRSELVATPDNNSQNADYAIYQCLNFQFVEWLPQNRQATATPHRT
jgi:hypothetical protein